MFVHKSDPLQPQAGGETPEKVVLNRRRWLRAAGVGAGVAVVGGAGYWAYREFGVSEQAVLEAGASGFQPTSASKIFPADRDGRFKYGRTETDRAEAAQYTNFYEFGRGKSTWRHVGPFQPWPWRLTIDGLCRNPLHLDLEVLLQRYADEFTERQYRHRCVETWAMAVPWTGIPLARLLKDADPLAEATHVRFVSFHRPRQATRQQDTSVPWPYTEGLTLPEAANDLTLLATGMFGKPLLKQHGAPLRLVVPWKYGYKSIKSIDRIELVAEEPNTFWTTLNPRAYPFQSNVDPNVAVPWSQKMEWMLGTEKTYLTSYLNGYDQYVGHLYKT